MLHFFLTTRRTTESCATAQECSRQIRYLRHGRLLVGLLDRRTRYAWNGRLLSQVIRGDRLRHLAIVERERVRGDLAWRFGLLGVERGFQFL